MRWTFFHSEAQRQKPPSIATLPPRLIAGEKNQITLSFPPKWRYVKVVFNFNGDSIWVTGPNRVLSKTECAFIFDLSAPKSNREWKLDMGVRKLDGNRQEPVEVYYIDENDLPLADTEFSITELKERRWSRGNIATLVSVLVAFASWAPKISSSAESVWARRQQMIDQTKMFVGWYPTVYKGDWSYDLADDRSAKWDSSESWSTFDHGSVKLLRVPTERIGVAKIGRSSLYDFKVTFRVSFAHKSKTAWAYRVNPKRTHAYAFVLEESKSKVLLSGFRYSNDKPWDDPLGEPQEIPIEGCCVDDDAFDIDATVTQYRFEHTITRQSLENKLVSRPELGHENRARAFEDDQRKFRYGNFGLLAPAKDSETAIRFVHDLRELPGTP